MTLHFRVATSPADWLFVENHVGEVERRGDLSREWLREKAGEGALAVVIAEALSGVPVGWLALCCTAEMLYVSALYFLPNQGWPHRRMVWSFLRETARDAGLSQIGFEGRRGWRRLFPGARPVPGTNKSTVEV